MRFLGIRVPRVLSATFLSLLAACGSTPGLGGDDGGDDDDDGGDDDASTRDGGAGSIDGGPDQPDAAVPDAAVPDATPPDANTAPQTLTVCASGADHTTIGAAITAASVGDTIEVCAGTYAERLTIAAKALTLIGTAGAAQTIIDGGDGGTVLTIRNTGGPGVVVRGFTIRNGTTNLEGGGIRCETSALHLLDSFVFQNQANGGGGLYATGCQLEIAGSYFDGNDGSEYGGGALITGSTGEIRGSFFIANQAVYGGALKNVEGAVAIRNSEFRQNYAALRGGAIWHESDAELVGNVVHDNDAGWTGGGIQIFMHGPLLFQNTVTANTSINDGGGVYADNSTLTMRANTVRQNVTGDDGGGIRMFECACTLDANLIEANEAGDSGAGVRISHVPCLITDNIVRNNVAGNVGGGYDLDNDASTMRGGEITGNRAGGKGGGIHTWLAPFTGLTLEDVLIQGNRAWKGGGIFIDDNFKPVNLRRMRILDNHAGLGGGIFVRATNLNVTDTVLAGNDANTGAAIQHEVADPWTAPECPCPPTSPVVNVRFSVMYGNEGEGIVWSNTPGLTVESSIVFGNDGNSVVVTDNELTPGVFSPPTWRYNDAMPATFVGMGDPTGSSGNLSVDPLFVAPVEHDFHLQPGSACIDAGHPEMQDTDGTRADMGLIGGAP